MRRFSGLLLTTIVLLVAGLFLYACSASKLNDFLMQREGGELSAEPVFQKKFSGTSMSRQQLVQLLDMSLDSSSPDKYGDIVFRERSVPRGKFPVVFSHKTHRMRYTCRVCHVELEFSMNQGDTGITREDNLDGRFCGACHNGDIAFDVKSACDSCHIKADKDDDYTPKTFASASLPAQEYGDGVNWVEAMRRGVIAPRNSIYDEEVESMPLPSHLERPMLWTTRVPRTLVHFSHVDHIKWLDCANCHPDTFNIERMGTVAFDKEKILYGMFCGSCHMTVAFPMNGCSRCHGQLKDRVQLPPTAIKSGKMTR